MIMQDVKDRIEEIKRLADAGADGASRRKDALYEDFVEYVAVSGPLELRTMAKEILFTKGIEF